MIIFIHEFFMAFVMLLFVIVEGKVFTTYTKLWVIDVVYSKKFTEYTDDKEFRNTKNSDIKLREECLKFSEYMVSRDYEERHFTSNSIFTQDGLNHKTINKLIAKVKIYDKGNIEFNQE